MPPTASRVSLVRASTTTLEVCWSSTPTAQAYLLEVQKIEQPPAPQPVPITITKKQHQPISAIPISVNEGRPKIFHINLLFFFFFLQQNFILINLYYFNFIRTKKIYINIFFFRTSSFIAKDSNPCRTRYCNAYFIWC